MIERMSRWWIGCGLACILVSASCRSDPPAQRVADPAPGPATAPGFTPVTMDLLGRSPVAGPNWPVYGGGYGNLRYSELDQIDRGNVSALTVAWVHQTGASGSFVTTPLVIDNTMYLTTPESGVIALNAATGEKLWEYSPELGTRLLCCGPINRGVAAWGDKVFVGTVDARLIALNNRSGEVEWEVRVADPADGYSLTMAPLAYAGKVVIGTDGGEYGIRGFVAAYDADSGDLAWRWHTVPAPDEAPNGWWGEWRQTDPFGVSLNRDLARETEDSARYAQGWRRGGGPVRMTPAYDPATRTLYVSVGNPSPNLDGIVRPGDNLYTSSIVALDAEEGTLRWHLQLVPHNRWDMDASSPPFLFDLDGRRLVGHAAKTGWLYVIDAASGEPVLRSQNFVPQENLFAEPGEEGTRILPGANGGAGWSPVAVAPREGLAFVLGMHQPMLFARRYTPYEPGHLYLGGVFLHLPDEDQWGTLSAIDLRTGRIRWQLRLPTPGLGAPLATAGGLLFVGQGHGRFDAFDAESGELLWQFRAGAGVHGGPISYQVDGVQYVAVAAGGEYLLGTPPGSAVFVFALGDVVQPTPAAAYARVPFLPSEAVAYGAVRQVPSASMEQDPESDATAEPDPAADPERP